MPLDLCSRRFLIPNRLVVGELSGPELSPETISSGNPFTFSLFHKDIAKPSEMLPIREPSPDMCGLGSCRVGTDGGYSDYNRIMGWKCSTTSPTQCFEPSAGLWCKDEEKKKTGIISAIHSSSLKL